MKRLLLIVSFFLLITPSFAQKRSTHWYLGRNVGLNFQNSTPSAHTNGRQDAFEASASISDLSGNLIFYTDGQTVWNKDHASIQNGTGLYCHTSATQGAIIIPKPGSKTIFYLFTLDAGGNNTFNLYYSELDLTLNNGLGGVTSNKNILVKSGVSERLAATWKADGSGIWLAVRDASSAYFHTFLVNSQGVQLTPISTAAGSTITSNPGVQAGQMKFTPDGRYLAWACKGDRFLEVLQFNSENGTFNSSYSRKATFTSFPYGVEFSNSGNFLYVSVNNLGIYQYDMGKLMTETLFRSSKIQISTATAYGMQLAKNGAIYVASYNYNLHAILSPTLAGTNCDYEGNAVSLGSGFSRDGMPSFISTYFLDKPIVSSDSCVGNDVRFTFRMETGDSLRWYFGDPASVSNTSTDPTPVHIYNTPGNYDVTLYMYHDGGVQETYTHTVHIHGFPQFTLGPDTTICYGQQYLLSPSVTFASYLWQDGKTQSVLSVLNTGTYHVRVQKNGCASFDTVNIVIDKPQVELLVSSDHSCANQNAFNFSINQPGTLSEVSWTFGDGATSGNRQIAHSYAGAGAYDVRVQTTNGIGCTAKAETQVIVKELVPALLSVNATEQCFSGHVFETAFTGDPDDENLLSYAISFSDGYLKKDEGVSHSFAAPGKKTVKLITTSKEFCKDTATLELDVLADPVARFTVDSSLNCQANNRITVNGFSSVSANGSIVSWKFESNGSEANGVQTSFSYPAEGNYPVYLRIEDAKGCKAAANRVINIYPNPLVDFKLNENSNCIGTNPVKATNLTSISDGSVTSYLWDFGDGETSNQFEPEKQFGEANTYVVRLTATSDHGCQASSFRNIVTHEVPVADFEIVNFEACLNENRLDIINKAGIKGTDALTYEWDLDGDLLTGEDIINYRFTSEGPKLVTLKVTSEKGCVSEMQTSVMLLPSPKANFIVNQAVQCLTENKFLVLFEPQVETSPIESVVWKLGDGRIFDGPDATFSYTGSGVYPFELEVKNMAGCVTTAVGNTIVSPQPKASFSADPVCVSSPMHFVNNSSISGGSIVSYSWFFGDNHQSQNMNPQHKFAESGEYPVLLEVSSDMGCKDYLVQKVQVKSEPVASYQYRKYGYKQDQEETIYEFVCNDYIQGHVVNWYVKGQKVATGERAFIGFKDTGYYDVTMLVENGAGCPASSHQSVFVIPPFELFLPTAFSPNKDGINETFRPEGNSYIGEYEMIVVNRWGSVIFQSHSVQQGWDGTFSGAESEPGVYIYYIKLTDIEGEEWEFKGTVILIK